MNDETKWIKELSTVADRDEDAVIIITGPERKGGKSNTAGWLGSRIDPDFDESRMCFSGSDFMAKAIELPKGSVLVLDEAIQGGFSRDAMKKSNTDLAKFLIVAGERNLVTIICFPNIKFLDRYVKEHRAQYWILMERRGVGKLHLRRRSDYPGSNRGWHPLGVLRNIPDMKLAPWWGRYLAKKDRTTREVGQAASDETWVPTEQDVKRVAQKVELVLNR